MGQGKVMKKLHANFIGMLRGFFWMILWAVVGYLLLVLVYCLPVDRMQKHLESSLETFQDGSKTLVKDDSAMWLDYLTDATILSETIYQGGQSPFEKAAAVYSNMPEGAPDQNWPYQKVSAAMQESDRFSAYARYWHGFLLYTKPLLFIFDYKDILTLNMFAQLFLMFWSVHLLAKQNGGGYGLLLPATVAFGMLTPPAMTLCLQYMPCFYVMAAACIVLLRHHQLVERHAAMFFLTVGMATSYFDFLTFPLVTLGMPLVLYLMRRDRPGRNGISTAVRASVCWGIGYAGFWAMKWVLGSLVLGENLFGDALGSLALRSSHETEGQAIGYLEALQKNLGVYFQLRIWKALAAGVAVALVLRVVWMLYKKIPLRKRLGRIVPLLLVAGMPFAWYFVTVNHSYIHYGYTHKELMITGWALACAAVLLFRKEEPTAQKHK